MIVNIQTTGAATGPDEEIIQEGAEEARIPQDLLVAIAVNIHSGLSEAGWVMTLSPIQRAESECSTVSPSGQSKQALHRPPAP